MQKIGYKSTTKANNNSAGEEEKGTGCEGEREKVKAQNETPTEG